MYSRVHARLFKKLCSAPQFPKKRWKSLIPLWTMLCTSRSEPASLPPPTSTRSLSTAATRRANSLRYARYCRPDVAPQSSCSSNQKSARKNCNAPIFALCIRINSDVCRFQELLYEGVNVDVIHADRPQGKRDEVVRNFRQGITWVLICTDLMGRGIDFKGVNLVINYDFPQSVISYIHRIGRTGRAGKNGAAITYFTQVLVRQCLPVGIRFLMIYFSGGQADAALHCKRHQGIWLRGLHFDETSAAFAFESQLMFIMICRSLRSRFRHGC